MNVLKTSVGNLTGAVGTAVTGSTKIIADVTTLAGKTAEQGVALTGKTIDTGFAISEVAVEAVGDVAIATTQAAKDVTATAVGDVADVAKATSTAAKNIAVGVVGNVADVTTATSKAATKITTAAVGDVADTTVASTEAAKKIAVATAQGVGDVGTTALKEVAQVGIVTLEGTGKTLRAAEKVLFNTAERTFNGLETMSEIAATAGSNTALRLKTSQAAATAGIETLAPEKIRSELIRVFNDNVKKNMQNLLRVADKTQMANLKIQMGVFNSAYCYGVSGFFKKYLSTHVCPKEKPKNNPVPVDLQKMKTFSKSFDGKFNELATLIASKLGAAVDASNEYAAIIEEFRVGAAKLVDELTKAYADVIQKYKDYNDKYFSQASAGGRRRTRRRHRSRFLSKKRVKRT